jgi:feruloyl esterase
VTLLATAVVAAYDAKDGVQDGIISDPQMCRFDPRDLQCKAVYPGSSPGFESGYRMPTPGSPTNPLFTDMPRFVGHQNTNWDVMSFDLDADLALAMKNAAFIESTDPDLAKVQGPWWKASAISRLRRSRSGSAKHD